MHTARFGIFRTVATIVASLWLLGGCGSDEQEQPPAAASVADEPVPAPAPAPSVAREARSVISEEMPYGEVGDHLVYGHFVAPSDMFEPLPAVIMIHEWWGLNDEVRARADRLAAQGYIVLAVDLFDGQTASEPAVARKLMQSVIEDTDAANENIRSAFAFVRDIAGAPRVGAVGWRFGGTWALNTAMLLPGELDAAVVYYGPVTSDEESLRPVTTPILGLFAGDDVSVRVDTVEAFRDALERLRKDYDIQVYAGVGQRFASASAQNYDKNAADDAWNRTLAFLERHLGAADTSSTDGS